MKITSASKIPHMLHELVLERLLQILESVLKQYKMILTISRAKRGVPLDGSSKVPNMRWGVSTTYSQGWRCFSVLARLNN